MPRVPTAVTLVSSTKQKYPALTMPVMIRYVHFSLCLFVIYALILIAYLNATSRSLQDFYGSQVSCDGFSACSSSFLFSCSCCTGYACDGVVPSCTSDPVGFCASQFLRRTCKDWGNPVCDTITVDPLIESVDVIICDKGNCAGMDFSLASVFCNNKNNAAVPATCANAIFQDSLVVCVAGACQNAAFTAVEVSCFAGRDDNSNACDFASFSQSTVDCYDDGCDSAQFTVSFRRSSLRVAQCCFKRSVSTFFTIFDFTGKRGDLSWLF